MVLGCFVPRLKAGVLAMTTAGRWGCLAITAVRARLIAGRAVGYKGRVASAPCI